MANVDTARTHAGTFQYAHVFVDIMYRFCFHAILTFRLVVSLQNQSYPLDLTLHML